MYKLHEVAQSENNDGVTHVITVIDPGVDGWEPVLSFFGNDDLAALYKVLHDYFGNGTKDDEIVEIEALEPRQFKNKEDAIFAVRTHWMNPKDLSDEQVWQRIEKAIARDEIPGTHKSINGKDWWLPSRALESYLSNETWMDPKPMPETEWPIIFLPNDYPVGNNGLTVGGELAKGYDVCHILNGVWYDLYLNSEGQAVGIVAAEHYREINGIIPVQITRQPIKIPEDRKKKNAILNQYGYRWKKEEEVWNLYYTRGETEPRLIGQGEDAVQKAFEEINALIR